MEEKKQEIIPTQTIVQPAVNAAAALESFRKFQEIKDRVLTDKDKQKIANKPYINKSGWRKIKTIFNLTQEILKSKSVVEKDKLKWIYRVRVTAKNGAFADAEMSCDTAEPFGKNKTEAAIMAMAQTRAFNRAISDLVGGGEPSVEEGIVEERTITK